MAAEIVPEQGSKLRLCYPQWETNLPRKMGIPKGASRL